MKNRYFGDIHDYIKYSLLRHFSASEDISTVVCWMLTEDDGGTDGRRTKYLRDPNKWRDYDPVVFDFLVEQVILNQIRNVSILEDGDILPNCQYYSNIIYDDPKHRQRYFSELNESINNSSLIFFDPDNGIEVKSVKYGKKKSSKYLYWHEIRKFNQDNHSLLIYQHFPYLPRVPFIHELSRKLNIHSDSDITFSIRNGQVVFFLIPQPHDLTFLGPAINDIKRNWEGVLVVQEHHFHT